MLTQIEFSILAAAALAALFIVPRASGQQPVSLDVRIAPADIALGEPVYLALVASNRSMQMAVFDVEGELKNLNLTYRAPGSNTFEPLLLNPQTGARNAYVGDVPPFGELKMTYLLNAHLPLNAAGVYEVVGRFSDRDPRANNGEIDRVFVVGPHSDTRATLMVHELAEKLHTGHTEDKTDAVEALCFVDSPDAVPEMITILADSPAYDTTIFDSLANRHGDTGVEALLRVLSTADFGERRLLIRGALFRRPRAIADPDLAKRVSAAIANP